MWEVERGSRVGSRRMKEKERYSDDDESWCNWCYGKGKWSYGGV